MAGAVDATIIRKDGKFEITPSKEGLTVDMDATKAALNEALNSENTDAIRVEASVTVKKPKVTEEDLATIKDVLGTFSTSFATSGASRSTNLAVGAGKINGHVLMPGEVLSGYECMHPFTPVSYTHLDVYKRQLLLCISEWLLDNSGEERGDCGNRRTGTPCGWSLGNGDGKRCGGTGRPEWKER